MRDRIANIIVFVEDREQQNLVQRYLERCGHTAGLRYVPLPAKATGGSGEKYVRNQYAEQVRACRSSLGRRASALLIVMIDADLNAVQDRQDQLAGELRAAGLAERADDEPIVILIPKRHVETWIRALTAPPADEETDYTKAPFSKPDRAKIRLAAEQLFMRLRPNATVPEADPLSLRAAIPELRKIPT